MKIIVDNETLYNTYKKSSRKFQNVKLNIFEYN
jgi:hypothetical protein